MIRRSCFPRRCGRSWRGLTRRRSPQTTEEIVDLLLLAGEERRAFVSYAHHDGQALAAEVFGALAESRFAVYLDRFRTTPSTDFVERIDDELRDKAMVVVVETPGAIASTWVLQEILTAKYRRYGLLALNIGGQPEHPEIGDGRRLRLPAFDAKAVCAAVERHHRAAVVDQRRRRATALRMALARAARMAEFRVSYSRNIRWELGACLVFGYYFVRS